MEINKIGSPNTIQPTPDKERVNSVSSDAVRTKDSVNFSEEGKAHALYTKAVDTIKNSEDIRMSKIEEARELIKSLNANGPSDEMLEVVARRILGDWVDLAQSSS